MIYPSSEGLIYDAVLPREAHRKKCGASQFACSIETIYRANKIGLFRDEYPIRFYHFPCAVACMQAYVCVCERETGGSERVNKE